MRSALFLLQLDLVEILQRSLQTTTSQLAAKVDELKLVV